MPRNQRLLQSQQIDEQVADGRHVRPCPAAQSSDHGTAHAMPRNLGEDDNNSSDWQRTWAGNILSARDRAKV